MMKVRGSRSCPFQLLFSVDHEFSLLRFALPSSKVLSFQILTSSFLVHSVDQALTFTSGQGKATINGKDQDVKAGDLMVVPAGTQHQFVNTGPTPLVRPSQCEKQGDGLTRY